MFQQLLKVYIWALSNPE